MKYIFLLLAFLPLISTGQYRVSTLEVGSEITTLESSGDGYLVYGTSDGELGYFDGLLLHSKEKVKGRVHRISKEEESYHVYTSRGWFRWTSSAQQQSGSHLDVRDATDGGKTICTSQGLFKREGTSYRPVQVPDLLSLTGGDRARYLHTTDHQYLLYGSDLYIYDKSWKILSDSVIDASCNGQRLVYMRQDGIYSSTGQLHYGSVEQSAQIYVCSDGRIMTTNQNFIAELKADDLRPIYSLSTATVTAISEDDWGNVWLAAPSYLYRVVRTDEVQRPMLKITSVDAVEPSEAVLTDSDVTIRYDGYHLAAPQSLVFQSRLEGFGDWSVATRSKSITYSDLPAGNYTYLVRSTTDGSNYTYSDPVKLRVGGTDISRYWWLVFLVGALIIATALVSLYRFNSFKEKIESERGRLLDKNKVLTLEQKALQLQMNPHFIFNALNSIKGLIARGDDKAARHSLTQFAQLMRSTLAQSRKEQTTIADEVAYIREYLALEQWVNEHSFEYTVHVEDTVPDDELIPTMLIQPFVENAIKHAFNSTSQDALIIVKVKSQAGSLQFIIEDNGVGMSDKKSTSHKSVAIDVVRERLALRYKRSGSSLLQIDSPISPSGGTRVTLSLP